MSGEILAFLLLRTDKINPDTAGGCHFLEVSVISFSEEKLDFKKSALIKDIV